MAILAEVAEWKLEAKLEDNARYFFHVKDVSRISSGSKAFVIGRKGSGKTAIGEHLCGLSTHDVFAEKLTFKNFPFNELYDLRDDHFTTPNQYVSLWKYVIYSCIARMMMRNQAIDSRIREPLERLYGKDPAQSLRRMIGKWTASDFSVQLLGTGAKISRSSADSDASDWRRRVDILEDAIRQYLDGSRYYIVFDELDEDYRTILDLRNNAQYTQLVTGLFKAAQDVTAIFSGDAYRIHPVVLLRDDIYEVLQDSDKNKWSDRKIDLDWDADDIQELLAFRLSRAIDPNSASLRFSDAWRRMFSEGSVPVGRRQHGKMETFDYIARSTLMRPRDFIHYLQVCAQQALQRNQRNVAPILVRELDKGFSNYLKNELVDEIHSVLPDIVEILDLMSQIRKQAFSIDEFRDAFERQRAAGRLQTADVEFVLKVLFHFSVIGNQPRQRLISVFRYQSKEARFNFSERVVIHRGLFKALQII